MDILKRIRIAVADFLADSLPDRDESFDMDELELRIFTGTHTMFTAICGFAGYYDQLFMVVHDGEACETSVYEFDLYGEQTFGPYADTHTLED